MNEQTKVCTKCGVEYPATKEWFVNNKICKNGIEGVCKKCRFLIVKKWSAENAKKCRALERKWRAENAERYRATKRKWEAENPKKRNASARRRYAENPEKYKAIVKKWQAENPEKTIFSDCKQRLKKQIGAPPPPELVEIKVLINKTKKLCKTLNS